MINLSLTNQIRFLKNSRFPELKWVLVAGVYVPMENLAKDGAGGRITFDGLKSDVNAEGHYPLKLGYAFLKLPDYLDGEANSDARKGIMAHELSHLICSETTSEWDADEEVVKRGLGNFLYTALKKRESMGISRKTGYTSDQIFSLVSRG